MKCDVQQNPGCTYLCDSLDQRRRREMTGSLKVKAQILADVFERKTQKIFTVICKFVEK
jgi:hypothetical protein